MNQLMLFHFMITKNDKHFQFLAQPGTNFDEIEAALNEFQAKFTEMKNQAIEHEKAKEAEKSSTEETTAIDPEVVA